MIVIVVNDIRFSIFIYQALSDADSSWTCSGSGCSCRGNRHILALDIDLNFVFLCVKDALLGLIP